MKREYIYIAAIIVLVNVLVWVLIPSKPDPNIEKELDRVKARNELLENKNDSIDKKVNGVLKQIDSLNNQLKTTKNALWREKKAHDKLRNRPATDPLLDSLLRAGLNR